MYQLEQIIADQRRELMTTDFASLVTRKEEKEIDLNSPLAQIVIGVRRSGKSTLCQKVLVESGVHFAYVNCDDVDIIALKSNQQTELQEALLPVMIRCIFWRNNLLTKRGQWSIFCISSINKCV